MLGRWRIVASDDDGWIGDRFKNGRVTKVDQMQERAVFDEMLSQSLAISSPEPFVRRDEGQRTSLLQEL